MAAEIDYAKILERISLHIESLRKDFPQLKDFAHAKNTNLKELCISYAYHTHPATDHIGWISGVPNPDEDGIWFYIDFHDPDSTAQIHTQPLVETSMRLGDKIAYLLILEGKDTKSVRSDIWEIMEHHTATPEER